MHLSVIKLMQSTSVCSMVTQRGSRTMISLTIASSDGWPSTITFRA